LSSSKYAVITLTLLSSLALAAPTQCPPYAGSPKNVLSSARLFDGPVEEMAELVPDQEVDARTTVWTVDGYRTQERRLILLCAYRNKSTLQVEIPKTASLCHVKGRTTLKAWCD
jgi:hypothetical protein